MKMKLPGVLAVVLFATASFTTIAATSIDRQQAQGLQSMGSVSISAERGSPDDAVRQLSNKAEEMGATHYRIIRLKNPGDSSRWSGNAEIYK